MNSVNPIEDEVHVGERRHIFFTQSEMGVPGSPLQPQKHDRNAERWRKHLKTKAALEKAKTESAPLLRRDLALGHALTWRASARASDNSIKRLYFAHIFGVKTTLFWLIHA